MNLDSLVDRIRTEVAHLTNDAPPASDEYRQQSVTSTLARVPVELSSGLYSALLAGGTPPTGLENTIATGAGICGHHVAVATVLMETLAVPVRDIQVFYNDGDIALNHTLIEVEWGDRWRMVDVTWGFVPHRGSLDSALSYEEAARDNHREGLHHTLIPWRNAVQDKIDIFGYLTPAPDGLYYDGAGAIRVDPNIEAVELRHPRICKTGTWAHRAGVDGSGHIIVRVPDGERRVTLQGSATRSGVATAGDAEQRVEAGEVQLEFAASGPADLEIRFQSDDDLGFVQVSSIDCS